jgi:hypothetical protein
MLTFTDVQRSDRKRLRGDFDGVGDVCDNCAATADPTQADGDLDGLGDVCDNCAAVANLLTQNTGSPTVVPQALPRPCRGDTPEVSAAAHIDVGPAQIRPPKRSRG